MAAVQCSAVHRAPSWGENKNHPQSPIQGDGWCVQRIHVKSWSEPEEENKGEEEEEDKGEEEEEVVAERS
jgi:hypothetical protein